jgi:hypothetical protein
VNLAPADVPKDGGRFDLPIALYAGQYTICFPLCARSSSATVVTFARVRKKSALRPSPPAPRPWPPPRQPDRSPH